MDFDLDKKAAAMVPLKRSAEATESIPIPSEKRLRISRDQVEDIFQTRQPAVCPFSEELTNHIPEDCPRRVFCPLCDDSANHILEDCPRRADKAWNDENPLYYYAVRKTDPNVTPKTTRDQPALCYLCLEITDHFPAYCKKYKSLLSEFPSPTPDDVENNRSYCSICLKYTDHDYNDCPLVCHDNRDSDDDSDWDY